MRILSRYILRRYLAWAALALAAFVAIFLVVDLTDRLNEFLDRAFQVRVILKYYAFYIPFVVVLTMPMVSLLACLFSVGDLARGGELTAVKASGVNPGRFLAPVLAGAAALSLLTAGIADRAVPGANRRRAEIERGGSAETAFFSVLENLVLRDAGGQVLSIGRYEVGARVGRMVSLDRYGPGAGPGPPDAEPGRNLRSRITAGSMAWIDDGWEWRDGVVREFTGGAEKARPFTTLRVEGVTLRPEDIERPTRKPEEMSYRELAESIDRRRRSGFPVRKELVELHLKLAFPLAGFVMALFGAPLAASLKPAGRGTTFGLCLLLSFLYYGSIKGCQAMGWNGIFAPALAAWAPNAVFATVGAWIYMRPFRSGVAPGSVRSPAEGPN